VCAILPNPSPPWHCIFIYNAYIYIHAYIYVQIKAYVHLCSTGSAVRCSVWHIFTYVHIYIALTMQAVYIMRVRKHPFLCRVVLHCVAVRCSVLYIDTYVHICCTDHATSVDASQETPLSFLCVSACLGRAKSDSGHMIFFNCPGQICMYIYIV